MRTTFPCSVGFLFAIMMCPGLAEEAAKIGPPIGFVPGTAVTSFGSQCKSDNVLKVIRIHLFPGFLNGQGGLICSRCMRLTSPKVSGNIVDDRSDGSKWESPDLSNSDWQSPLDIRLKDEWKGENAKTIMIKIMLEDKALIFAFPFNGTEINHGHDTTEALRADEAGKSIFTCAQFGGTSALPDIRVLKLRVRWTPNSVIGGLNIGVFAIQPGNVRLKKYLPSFVDPKIQNNG